MENFSLDPKLESDTIKLGEFDLSLLLLMDNALVPWFILVPKLNASELYELDADQQLMLWTEINTISEFLKEELHVDKINVAAIGNVVPQLHVHVIGRYTDDFAWPHTVWGRIEREEYEPVKFENLAGLLQKFLENKTILETI
ncbi:MAG: HIT family protein [Gammaproteobacteria bacterium]|nr:HIT family protein [Gammaproteobacteria bacterium]